MIKHYGSEGADVPRIIASTGDGPGARCGSECRSHPRRDKDMCSAKLVKLVKELVNLVKELVKVQKAGWLCVLQLSEPAPRVTPVPCFCTFSFLCFLSLGDCSQSPVGETQISRN